MIVLSENRLECLPENCHIARPDKTGDFLAGTVKKKLGFDLTSFKGKDDVRRYRIAPLPRR